MEWVERETEIILANLKRYYRWSWYPSLEIKYRANIKKSLRKLADHGLRVLYFGKLEDK